MDVIPGEYLLATNIDGYYYALTLNSKNEISYSDITLLFDGNYIKDSNGYYCVSVNTKYLWQQVTGTNQLSISGNVISNLAFNNDGVSNQSLT